MWLWRVFESAFVRKVAFIVAAALMGMLLGKHAHGQGGTCPGFEATIGGVTDVGVDENSACAAHNYTTTYNGVDAFTYSAVNIRGTGAGETWQCKQHEDYGGNPAGSGNFVSDSVTGGGDRNNVVPCPALCQIPNGQASYMALSSFVAPGSSTCAQDGCSYQALPSNANRQGLVNGDPTVLQVMTSTGNACTATAGAPVSAATVTNGKASSACTSDNGNTLCIQTSAAGLASETVNGSTVLPSFMAPNTCVSMTGGGVACEAPTGQATVPAPPGPDNGTAGTAADPVATIVEGGQTIQTFSAAAVAHSSKPSVTGSGKGSGGGAGSGTGNPDGSAPCPPGQTCGSTDSNSGGLDCSAPPTCTDTDPNLCGIMNQVWLERCATFTPTQLATAVGDPTDGGHVQSTTVDASTVTSETLLTGGLGQCPAPVTFVMFGKTVTYDLWSGLCRFAGYISFALLTVAYMVAARVFFVGVTANTL
jgi:hypothetical protein